ncbi:MAG: OmpA family protein [Pseudomonadota bacterium]
MIALLLGLALSAAARAEGASVDVELQRAWLGPGVLAGLDHAGAAPGTLTMGFLAQYLRDPLVLMVEGDETGAVIAQRHTLQVAAAYDLSRHLTLRGSLPVAWQWASEEPALAADGPGLADPSLGARWTIAQKGAGQAALRADALLPLGRRDAWLGEGAPRLALGLLPAVEGDGIGLHADLGVCLRRLRETDADFELGNEATLGLGLRVSPWPGLYDLSAAVLNRWPLVPTPRATLSSELLVGSRLHPRRFATIELGVGKGLADGYGTSEFRGWGAVSLAWRDLGSPRRLASPRVPWLEAPPIEISEEPEPPPPTWEEGQLARVHRARIEIREPIQFFYDTEEIRPESRPTLLAVADILAESPWILQVVVEGHASVEGEDAYNYALSNRRAHAIVQALVEAGVHPLRLSTRGMGETVPVIPGTDEASLALSRRVLFLIAEQLDPLDPLPELPPALVPWADIAPEEAP